MKKNDEIAKKVLFFVLTQISILIIHDIFYYFMNQLVRLL